MLARRKQKRKKHDRIYVDEQGRLIKGGREVKQLYSNYSTTKLKTYVEELKCSDMIKFQTL